ncbi:MAG: aldehyde dehydrogenase [Rhodobacteraceae bacterium]|jgi:gamma-glutamyl-gamma-aminobutyraldehyde dehydrogenase|nr:aldehyde dehydrogenase [Paracoccaceae bacterium]
MTTQAQIDAIRTKPVPQGRLLIAGEWQDGRGGETQVHSPLDGLPLTRIAAGDASDVDRAVAAARNAFERGTWSRMAPAARKKILHRIADRLEAEALEIAVLGVRDNGTELSMALKAEPLGAANTFRYYAEALDKIYGEIAPTAPDVLGLVHRGPVGVVGAIVPWNMPMMIGAWKLAPALAMGNSVVLKPAELASLTLLRLAAICTECGLPEGVLNVVTGKGSVAGEALSRHGDVDVLAFTGSNGVGRQLLIASAQSNLKRVYLELGGKSPNIVFADAPDLDRAARVATQAIFRNAGQVCVAGSRLLVEQSVHDEFVERVARQTAAMRVGDPLDLTTEVGAVVSEAQLQQNLSHVATAEAEGARRVTGGERILQETGGTYMRPAVMDRVGPGMALAREEVFGPVLAVLPFRDEAEAVQLANDTTFGLASAVWTGNLSRAHRMVAAIDAGVVHVNTYGGSDLTVPLGGHRQSGNGHDKSLHALEKYINLKTAWFQL